MLNLRLRDACDITGILTYATLIGIVMKRNIEKL